MEKLKITDIGHVLNKINTVVLKNEERSIELSEHWALMITKKTSRIVEVFILFEDKFFGFNGIPVRFTINTINLKITIAKAVALDWWTEQLVVVLAEIDIYKDFRRFTDEDFRNLVMG